MKQLILLLAFFFSATLQASEAQPRVHNHAPAFVDFWKTAKDWSLAEQIQEFDRTVYPTFPEFYDYRFESWARRGTSKTEGLRKVFDNYRSIHSKFSKKTESLGKEIEKNLATFLLRFPDFNTDIDIHIYSQSWRNGWGHSSHQQQILFYFRSRWHHQLS